jgi:hypothetical protein
MPEGDQSSIAPREVEAAVRQYIGRLAVRYVPLVAVLLALALILVLVPRADGGGNRTVASGTASGSEQGTTGSESFSATGAPVDGAGGAAGGTGGAGQGSTRSAVRGPGVPAGVTAPAAAGSAGMTKSGVACGPGVRQVKWTNYAPLCVPAYSGNNGGATSHGVTNDTITVSFRLGNSASDAAVYAAAGAAAPAPDPDFVS